MTRHYLDHNATAPVREEVIAIVAEAMAQDGNSLSVHEEGRKARAVVETARQQICDLIGAPVNSVIITSGGTESIHYALHGAVGGLGVKKIFVSAIEHAAVSANAATTGVSFEIIPCTSFGEIDLDWLGERLADYDEESDGAFLVCAMFANNETGVIQPVKKIAEIVHAQNGYIFTDAAQAVGKIPVNFETCGADLLAMTGHKFGGPVGVGALVVRPGLELSPVMRGGGHELNRRAGTTNTPCVAGLGAACELAAKSLARAEEIAALRDAMEETVNAKGGKIWGGERARLPGTLCLSADGFSGSTQLMALDLAGIAVSAGTACTSGKSKPSGVLTAMGATPEEAACSIRVSLGWNSTNEDAAAFIREWPAAYERSKSKAA